MAAPRTAGRRTGPSGPVADARHERCPPAVHDRCSTLILPRGLRRASYIGRLLRVLIAPDKFRGTLTAAQASRAIAVGWARSRPGDLIETVPMADGGEGTLEANRDARGGRNL